MRILVLGGTRFMGPHLVRELLAAGHEVTVFSRGHSPVELPAAVNRLVGDRRAWGDHASLLRSVEPDVVVDMMALTAADSEQLVATFAGVAQRLMLASSCDVYRAYGRLLGNEPGPVVPSPMDEDGPLRERLYPYKGDDTPPDAFAAQYDKILVESAAAADPRLPATVVRLPIVYGPGDYQHRLSQYLPRMDAGEAEIRLTADEAAARFCRGYVENMGLALALAATHPAAAGRIYNAAEAVADTETEWLARIAAAAGWEGQVVVEPGEVLPEHQDLAISTARIRAELGYVEPVDREEAMARTVAWERANPPAD